MSAQKYEHEDVCLLYTSDAADERSSVDLGGRRIIKKKKQRRRRGRDSTNYEIGVENTSGEALLCK